MDAAGNLCIREIMTIRADHTTHIRFNLSSENFQLAVQYTFLCISNCRPCLRRIFFR